MQVSTTSSSVGYATANSAASGATTGKSQNDATQADAASSSASAPAVGFSLSSLLSSEAVSTVLSTQEDGTFAWHDPGRILTNQESLAWNAVSSQNIAAKDNAHFSNAFSAKEKAFIRQTTGFNVVTFDTGLQQIVDDQGNLGTGPNATAAANMAMAMLGGQEGSLQDQDSASYFNNLFSTAAGAGQPYPADVIAKVKDWFATLLKTVSDSQDTHKDTMKSQTATQASNAAHAYAANETSMISDTTTASNISTSA